MPSLLAGAAVAAAAADLISSVKAWNMASALLPRREGLVVPFAGRVIQAVREVAWSRGEEQWEAVCYSLALHLRAGETPAQGVRAAAEEGNSPAHSVLRSVSQAYDAGTPLHSALFAHAGRDCELDQIASVFEMCSSSGGDIPALLCHVGESLRRRRLAKGELRSKLAEARATAALLAVLPWCIAAFTMRKDALAAGVMLHDSRGRALLAAAAAFWAVGTLLVAMVLRAYQPHTVGRRATGEAKRR